jgi:hypothetical protein
LVTVLVVDVVLTVLVVVLAFVTGVHWLWFVGVVGFIIAAAIGRLIETVPALGREEKQ